MILHVVNLIKSDVGGEKALFLSTFPRIDWLALGLSPLFLSYAASQPLHFVVNFFFIFLSSPLFLYCVKNMEQKKTFMFIYIFMYNIYIILLLFIIHAILIVLLFFELIYRHLRTYYLFVIMMDHGIIL